MDKDKRTVVSLNIIIWLLIVMILCIVIHEFNYALYSLYAVFAVFIYTVIINYER